MTSTSSESHDSGATVHSVSATGESLVRLAAKGPGLASLCRASRLSRFNPEQVGAGLEVPEAGAVLPDPDPPSHLSLHWPRLMGGFGPGAMKVVVGTPSASWSDVSAAWRRHHAGGRLSSRWSRRSDLLSLWPHRRARSPPTRRFRLE